MIFVEYVLIFIGINALKSGTKEAFITLKIVTSIKKIARSYRTII